MDKKIALMGNKIAIIGNSDDLAALVSLIALEGRANDIIILNPDEAKPVVFDMESKNLPATVKDIADKLIVDTVNEIAAMNIVPIPTYTNPKPRSVDRGVIPNKYHSKPLNSRTNKFRQNRKRG